MKRIFFICALVATLVCFCISPLLAQKPIVASKPTGSVPIIIVSDQYDNNENNRSLLPDVEAYFLMGEVTFLFNRNIGNADIYIQNLSTLDMIAISVNGCGLVNAYVGNEEGVYDIVIETNDQNYYGTFELI